jgi:hypothetical protein
VVPWLAVAGCFAATPLGTFEWEQFEERASTTPMPVAPPPMRGDHLFDLSVRQIGATRTSGGEIAAHRETGIHPLRTDVAGGARVSDWFAVRVLGSLAYGSPLGRPPGVGFPNRSSAAGGLGAVFGYWGDPTWSVALELQGNLVALDNHDRYATVRGPCFEVPSLFGGPVMSCQAEVRTGAMTSYQGLFVVPALGATLDVAARPTSWLRMGGGASVQELVSRNASGGVHHAVVGIARVFLELQLFDVWLGLEAQQWVIEDVTFAPALAVTIGGVAFGEEASDGPMDDALDGAMGEDGVEAERLVSVPRPIRLPPSPTPSRAGPSRPPRIAPSRGDEL